ncbi:MAG: hypothetical protein V4468_16865 [Pseudomonadota bacterium]
MPEPNKRHQLDSGFIKQMTGGDQMAARALYGDEKNFEPQFVLLMVTNVIPKLEDDDNALWRRLHIVPFDRSFSEDEVDPDLKEKLLAERSGILNLLLDGVRGYLTDGLSAPERVRRTSAKQRATIDPFKQWCEERILFAEKRVETSQKELLVDFQRWGVDNAQFRKLTQNEFRERLAALSDHQPIERIERGNIVVYAGIQLKE